MTDNAVNHREFFLVLQKTLLIPLFCLFVSGCFVTQEEFFRLQRQTAQLQSELKSYQATFTDETGQLKSSAVRLDDLHERLRKSFAETNARIDELDQRLSKLHGGKENIERETSKNLQNISEVIKTQNEMIRSLKAEIKKIYDELQQFRQQQSGLFSNVTSEINYLKTVKAAPAQKKEYSQKEKEEIYQNALDMYMKNDYAKAINAFENFLLLFPADPLSANALYWIGECYYSQKKFNDALAYFHRIITDFPNSNKVAAALLKEAYCLEELGMRKEAKAALEELTVRFPYTDEAKQAGKKLKKKP